MSRYPVKTGPNAPDTLKPKPRREPPRPADTGGFIRFRHTYRSMTRVNGQTHVKASQTRFENGRLETEEFEGTLDGETHADAVAEVQRNCLDGMTALFRSFWGIPPGFPSDQTDRGGKR